MVLVGKEMVSSVVETLAMISYSIEYLIQMQMEQIQETSMQQMLLVVI